MDAANSELDVWFDFNEVAVPVRIADLHFAIEAERENSIALVSRSEEGQVIRWEHALEGYELKSRLSFEGFGSALGQTEGTPIMVH